MQGWPSRSRLLSNAHAVGHKMGPKPPGGGYRTRRGPLLAWEAGGRSRRAVMWLVVGGGVMMVDRAPTDLAEGGQTRAGEGACITQGNA